MGRRGITVKPDASSEDGSKRAGFLSYAAEWHSFSIGFYDGMKSPKTRPKKLPENPDIQEEPHYYKGAYVLGTVLQLAIIVIVGAKFHGI